MSFFEELQIFGRTILKWIYSFLLATIFIFAFGLEEVVLLGRRLSLPFPSYESFAVIFFEKIGRDLLPDTVELIVISPLEAFWAQVGISFFLAFTITLPILLYYLLKYLLPAFSIKEKKMAFKALIPSVFLFLFGCLFSYYFLIPATIEILYFYVVNIGAASFFSVKEFVSMVLFLILGVGTLFMLPVFMILLGSLGIVDPSFWKDNWRYSFLIFLIFAAVITPDGSGITMVILSIPLTLLYVVGYIGSIRVTR